MSTAHPHAQVVVAYDFSPSAELALQRAIDVACRAPQHVLHVVAVIDPHRGLAILSSPTIDYQYAAQIEAMVLERVQLSFADRPTVDEVQFHVHARFGHAAQQILALAREVGADLVVLGSHGQTGVERLVLGSVSERVVREAACPVMVIRAKTYAHVDLLKVVAYEHDRKPYAAPHRYRGASRDAITRPNDFPIS